MFRRGAVDRGATDRIEDQLRETRDIAVRAETKADSHVVACIEHNKRVEDMLRVSAERSNNQHAENQQEIQGLHDRISGINGRINLMIIGALGAIALALFGALYAVFAHKVGLT